MKKVYLKICVTLFILNVHFTFGQFQNNVNPVGLDRSIGAESRFNEPQKKEAVDYTKVMLDNLTTKLKLDGFQSAIIKNIIKDFTATVNDISLEDIPNSAKTEKSNIAKTAMETKFKEILNEEQRKLFEEISKDSSGKQKKKKKKEKSSETEE